MAEWQTEGVPPEGRGNPLRKESVRCLVYIPGNPQQYRLAIGRYLLDRDYWIIEGSHAKKPSEISRWRTLDGLHIMRKSNEDISTGKGLRKTLSKYRQPAERQRSLGEMDSDIAGWSYDGKF